MKSGMAEMFDPEEASGYSDLQVLRSAAGYYVGTIYTGEDGFQEPGSRDSGYFATKEEAEKYLKFVEDLEKEGKPTGQYLRDQP